MACFDWLTGRSSGLLLHPTSLHGDQGIGVLGRQARQFIECLAESRIGYWQMLPLGPTGFGDSPYSSLSAFAGNPYLIDLEPLLENGLLQQEERDVLAHLPEEHVDFLSIQRIKWPLLRLAHKRFVGQERPYLPNYGLYKDFLEESRDWLEPFTAFMGLKERFGGDAWVEWPEECRTLERARDSRYWKETAQAREAHAFFQYLFFGQWRELRAHASHRGIRIIGDIPIFVALDSADTWASPGIFQMAEPGKPSAVAGVPPDYFSETGQLWGNPLYDWSVLEQSGFQWWIERLRANCRLFDVIRLDHFRGFHGYWRIPAGAADARKGSWVPGPRERFFEAVARQIPEIRLIAEDLGEIDDAVRDFLATLGMPGMAVLQFAFGGGGDNPYLPHNLVPNSVVYPGTHDNNTTLGWYEAADEETRDHVRRYLRVGGEDISWDCIRSALASVARLAVLPVQDLLSIDASGRMNLPGSPQGNWSWRMTAAGFEALRHSSGYLRELAWLYGREQAPSKPG